MFSKKLNKFTEIYYMSYEFVFSKIQKKIINKKNAVEICDKVYMRIYDDLNEISDIIDYLIKVIDEEIDQYVEGTEFIEDTISAD